MAPNSLIWPDGGTSPFRGEKASTHDGGLRVPLMVRWPAKIQPGRVSNEINSHDGWLVRHMFVMVPFKDLVTNFMATFKDYPPRQERWSFTLRQ